MTDINSVIILKNESSFLGLTSFEEQDDAELTAEKIGEVLNLLVENEIIKENESELHSLNFYHTNNVFTTYVQVLNFENDELVNLSLTEEISNQLFDILK